MEQEFGWLAAGGKLPITFSAFGFVRVPSAANDGHALVEQWLVSESGRKCCATFEADSVASPGCHLDIL